MKTIIVGGGTAPSKLLLKKELQDAALLIAVDAGANCLFKYHIAPHYIIGDCDSIAPQILGFFQHRDVTIEKYPCNKDASDTLLAVTKAIKLGATEISLLGCVQGQRIDHLLANFGILSLCADLKIQAWLKDEHNVITMLATPTIISGKPKQIFSVQAFCDVVKNLSIYGGKFELDNYDLRLGESLTLSNEFLHTDVHISFTSGKLLLFINN